MNDYIIVGGGIGGLYFIDKLLDKGVVGNILLVEKTLRLGGRVSSGCKFNYERQIYTLFIFIFLKKVYC